ncbi:MAG TPA: hypothetical protein VFT59_04320 [Candidatus Saccharimonadales bacterium]|nr:hypothetical protein [Candidatus Saccharimonadales bacterium]
MPRRDGQPTNQEMLADFTTASFEIYMNLYDLHMQPDLPPAYEGKPLRHISAHIIKRYFSEDRPPQSVAAEQLKIATLSPYHVDIMENDHLQMRDFPPDVFEYYRGIADSMAQVALTNGMILRNIVPPNGVVGFYTAFYPNGSIRHVDKLKDKPTKQTIAAAQYFTEEVSEYISSGRSQLPPTQLALNAHYNNEEGVMTHHFDIDIATDLPLNGQESTQFLTAYRDKMIERYHRKQALLEQLAASVGTQTVTYTDMMKTANECKAAADRAQVILDRR